MRQSLSFHVASRVQPWLLWLVARLHPNCLKPQQISSLRANTNKPLAMKTYILWLLVTAYCPCKMCCGPHACHLTADGHQAKGHIVSAPTKYPFGTPMYVPGYGWATVHDRGSRIKGNHIDILLPSHKAAKLWGSKWLPVTIKETPPNE